MEFCFRWNFLRYIILFCQEATTHQNVKMIRYQSSDFSESHIMWLYKMKIACDWVYHWLSGSFVMNLDSSKKKSCVWILVWALVKFCMDGSCNCIYCTVIQKVLHFKAIAHLFEATETFQREVAKTLYCQFYYWNIVMIGNILVWTHFVWFKDTE